MDRDEDIQLLKRVYDINDKTGNYIIETYIKDYIEIFNNWDNSPYRKRNLEPDFEEFLDECSEEIPFKKGVDICFTLPKEKYCKENERLLIQGIKTYYYLTLQYEKRLIKGTYKKALIYIIIANILLVLRVFLEVKLVHETILYNIILEGFNIGGWVFLWEAISIISFKRQGLNSLLKKYKRFIRAHIYFKYK